MEAVIHLKSILDNARTKFKISSYQEDISVRLKNGADYHYWSNNFDIIFVINSDTHRDDLLFYVKGISKKKEKEEIEVLRRDSLTLPRGDDPSILWDETFYLNFLLHEVEYNLTFCSLMSGSSSVPVSSRIMKKVCQQVYLTYTERRMDKKDHKTVIAYPNLMFYIDNFEEVFNGIMLSSPGEKVIVQIIASNPLLSLRKPIFIGGLDYRILRQTCQSREDENTSYLQSMLHLGRRKSSSNIKQEQGQYHFIPMAGPNGKGQAEMAVNISYPEHSTSLDNVDDEDSSDIPTAGQESSTIKEITKPINSQQQQQQQQHDSKLNSKVKNNNVINAYLTYVSLPWYVIIEDILKGSHEPLI